ncbi:MAG TPA: DNA glycosylase [Desulfuromonadaceae bacterium]|nr:DNA glycosylase [Desulfuromonadaceae bacterium]
MPETILPVRDYDLAGTLDSGQVFRWTRSDGDSPASSWTGVVGDRVVHLTQREDGIHAETPGSAGNWDWLRHFLQSDVDLASILKTFPDDEPMRRAVAACRGLRVLRQDPWECLASFILSSTKQIVQIRQIVANLCDCFGEPIIGNARRPCLTPHALPSAEKIASLTEVQLRSCKMGFRAPNLLAAARQVAGGQFDLERLRTMSYADALHQLMALRGVGKKIGDCVLLFAYGFDSAFPVDVWVERALRELYFPKRRPSEKKLRHFAATHFGPHAGYAQQYLFHYMRTKR